MSKEGLTRYEGGSIRELLSLSWPLMLASAANSLMLFGDRLVLSYYSKEAFNASVGAIPWFWTFYITLFNLISVAGILVGRLNGSRQIRQIGGVVWQAIWFSLMLFVLTIPVGLLCPRYFLAAPIRELGTPYLSIIFVFMPLGMLGHGALSSFFTGRGKTKLVSLVVLLSNILNLLLDLVLVFGFCGFPEMGIRGAAWATVIAEVFPVIVLGWFFFNRKNRTEFGTSQARLNGVLWREFFHIGAPTMVSCFINFTLWSLLLQAMAIYVSADNFFAFGVATSVYNALFFTIQGGGQAVGTISSNAFGAKNASILDRLMTTSFNFSVLNAVVMSVFMVFYPDLLIGLLTPPGCDPSLLALVRKMLLLCWIAACCGECFCFCLRGMLVSFGDAKFTMFTSIFTYGVVAALPGYLVLRATRDSSYFLIIEILSHLLGALFYMMRYRCFWHRKFSQW